MRTSSRRTHGFTLVEIIAVLIILAVLLAVAIPKYFSLVDEARRKACAGAAAEGKSLCSLVYSRLCLLNGAAPTAAAVAGEAQTECNTMAGDFAVTTAANAGGTGITVSVTGRAGTQYVGYTYPNAANATEVAACLWPLP